MFWTIICLGVGWYLGRNWEDVKKFAMEKLGSKKSIDAGKVTKID